MKTRKLIFIGLMLCIIGKIQAQEKYLGLYTGISFYNMTDIHGDDALKNDGLIGLRAEYHPNKAIFSVVGSVQYLTENKYIQVPLTINFLIGNKFKFKIMGGVVPTIRVNTVAPNKSFVIGGQLGIGIEYKISDKCVLFCDLVGYAIPGLEYTPSHSGGEDIARKGEGLACISIGVKYLINTINQ
jgi:hypothetical protein